jgi:hypothetical protein
MIYECDRCNAALPSGAQACPKCGAVFHGVVPADAPNRAPGFTARPMARSAFKQLEGAGKMWTRIEQVLARVLALVTLVLCAVSSLLLYVIVCFRLPQGGDAPDWVDKAEATAGYTLIFSLLPVLVLLCVWVVAAVSSSQARNKWRMRMVYACSFCYIVSWVLLMANLSAVKEVIVMPDWIKSTSSEMTFALFAFAGSLLGAFAAWGRLRQH